jgi:hypothetical protein
MTPEFEGDGLVQLGATANLAGRYAAEGREFVEMLASMLESTLPGETQVERRGALFSAKSVAKLRVHFGDFHYALEAPRHGPLLATRSKVVRGISLKTDTLSMDEWLEEVGAQLSALAQTNRQASEALQKLTGA